MMLFRDFFRQKTGIDYPARLTDDPFVVWTRIADVLADWVDSFAKNQWRDVKPKSKVTDKMVHAALYTWTRRRSHLASTLEGNIREPDDMRAALEAALYAMDSNNDV